MGSEKTFEYDACGNPISEKFIGDLSGRGRKQVHEIKREFSQDGFQLLLREEDVKTIYFSYLPGTNLLASKLIKNQNFCLLREFRFYDKSYNLIRIVKDDGNSDSANDLSNVTYRLITDFQLRQQPPFLHMPASMEEKYVENGEERQLKHTEFLYDSHGYVIQERIYDAEGQFAYAIDKAYDEQGNLLAETNALGQKIIKTFDPHGREKTSNNFANTLHQAKEYDKRGNLSILQETGEGISRTHAYSYDLRDRLIKKIDNYQHATSYVYDLVANQPSQVEGPPLFSAGGNILPVVKKTIYDALGRDILSLDPNGNGTAACYNAYGSPTAIVHPDQSQEKLRYTKNGLLESHFLPNGLVIYYQYDVLGHVIEKEFYSNEELLATETFVYKGDLLIRYTDLEGHITEYSYDGAGRKVREERCGHATTYHYDPLGDIDLICEENGDNSLYTHFRRNLLGQVLEKRETDAQGNVLGHIAYTYDSNGNVKTIERKINGKEAVDSFTYDACDREILHQDTDGFITHTSYDEKAFNPFGQQVLKKTTTDPQHRIVEETFDPYGRLTKQETFSSSNETIAAEEHEYDPCGNSLRHTDFVYQGTDFITTKVLASTYDPCHRITTSTRAFGTPDARATRFTYAPGGNLTSKTLPDELTLTYTYDPFDNLKTVRSSDGRLSHTFHYNRLGYLLKAIDELNSLTVVRQLDPHGNILQEKIDDTTVTKTYDNFNRPLSLSLPDHTKILYTYDPLFLKKVERLSLYNSYHHTYGSYDTSGFLIEEQLISNLGAVFHETDLLGRPTVQNSDYFSQTCQYDSMGQLINQSIDYSQETFAYDPLSQLIEEPAHTYSYDSTYNRLQKDHAGCQSNGLDEQLSVGPIACTYDLRGNLIGKKVHESTYSFAYTPLNQLSEATIGNTKVCFSYDPLGRRIGRKQYTLTNHEYHEVSNDILFYDGNQEIGQIEQGNIQQLRVLGRQHPVAIELQGKAYAPLLDARGNIRRLIDTDTETIVAHYSYSAFGEQSINEQPLFNPWQYAAKRLDFDLGLIDFGKRHYDPQLGRWMTLDPLGFINHRNLYQYNFNNPFRYYDPNGTFAFAIPIFLPVIEITFGWIVTWISAEAVLGTAIGATIAYGVYNVANGIEAATADGPAVHQEAVLEEKKRKPNTNPFEGPVDGEIFVGDANGNIIPVPEGYQLGGSKDGECLQQKDKDGRATGIRKDGKGHPSSPAHRDPRSQNPHGHVPGVNNLDGTPWLPIR